jgi:3-deoxy-D-manno-octulosonic-acid transferase
MPALLQCCTLLYGLLWRMARTFLRRHRRLADNFERRLELEELPDALPADIWIQAASGGEAFLVRRLVQELVRLYRSASPLRLLCTACTRQGLDILEKTARETPQLTLIPRFFPLDEPAVMRRALKTARPRMAALLETELWPGLLLACAEQQIPVILINGRMREKSLNRYMLFRFFWKSVAPFRILAVSDEDAARFAVLFGQERVAGMPNMKFDDMQGEDTVPDTLVAAPDFPPLILLASIRRQEESLLEPALRELLRRAPHAAVVLAPRHMERVSPWMKKLRAGKFPAVLRSELREGAPLPSGVPILWDHFGDLRLLYRLATAVFVGGSLAPLGGQNFLEALAAGLQPCIGPHRNNFAWVGEELFASGLIRTISDAASLAPVLLAQLAAPADKQDIRRRFAAYLASRKGGSTMAAALLVSILRTDTDKDSVIFPRL